MEFLWEFFDQNTSGIMLGIQFGSGLTGIFRLLRETRISIRIQFGNTADCGILMEFLWNSSTILIKILVGKFRANTSDYFGIL